MEHQFNTQQRSRKQKIHWKFKEMDNPKKGNKNYQNMEKIPVRGTTE